ncbi:MAG: hypothetical protein AAGC55_06625, partial [Myxococcota bacterium]
MRRYFLLPILTGALVCLGCGGSGEQVAVVQPDSASSAGATGSAAQTAAQPIAKPTFSYPQSRRGDVVDTLHGTQVADPYRWLEDPKSDETQGWIAAQNKITFGFLEGIGVRESIRQRLTAIWDYEKYGAPMKRGGRYFFSKNDGLQNQSVIYWTESLSAEPKVLLDPNKMSEDGTVALSGMSVSEDGKYVAYSLQSGGSDWQEWHVREVATGKDLGDHLKWSKFSGAAWTHDSKGFFYSRYPEPKAGANLTEANYFQKLYYHRLGTDQSQDELIYERPDEKKWGFGGRVSDDGRYLLISVWKGTGNENLVFFRDLGVPIQARGKRRRIAKTTQKPIRELVSKFESNFSFIDNKGPVFWFFTDLDAPRGRIIAIDTRRPQRKNWKEIIPQSEHTLRGANIVGDKLIASYLKDAHSQIVTFDLNGKRLGEVALPGIGSAGGFAGRRGDSETFYSFTSFTTPSTIYRYDVKSGTSEIFRQPKVAFDTSGYETKQIFY